MVSHAVLFVCALSYGALTRDFQERVKSANGAESARDARLAGALNAEIV
jgi:hypothetical protein